MPATKPLVIGSISAEETKGIPWCPLKNPTTPAGYTSLGWYRFRYIRSMHSTSRVTWLARTSATLAGRLIPGSGRHCSYESANRFGRFNAGPATIPHLGSAGAYDLPPALRIASSGWGGAALVLGLNVGPAPTYRKPFDRRGLALGLAIGLVLGLVPGLAVALVHGLVPRLLAYGLA